MPDDVVPRVPLSQTHQRPLENRRVLDEGLFQQNRPLADKQRQVEIVFFRANSRRLIVPQSRQPFLSPWVLPGRPSPTAQARPEISLAPDFKIWVDTVDRLTRRLRQADRVVRPENCDCGWRIFGALGPYAPAPSEGPSDLMLRNRMPDVRRQSHGFLRDPGGGEELRSNLRCVARSSLRDLDGLGGLRKGAFAGDRLKQP
jgi:hypothetical protein